MDAIDFPQRIIMDISSSAPDPPPHHTLPAIFNAISGPTSHRVEVDLTFSSAFYDPSSRFIFNTIRGGGGLFCEEDRPTKEIR